jgi:hypothetical protein
MVRAAKEPAYPEEQLIASSLETLSNTFASKSKQLRSTNRRPGTG